MVPRQSQPRASELAIMPTPYSPRSNAFLWYDDCLGIGVRDDHLGDRRAVQNRPAVVADRVEHEPFARVEADAE